IGNVDFTNASRSSCCLASRASASDADFALLPTNTSPAITGTARTAATTTRATRICRWADRTSRGGSASVATDPACRAIVRRVRFDWLDHGGGAICAELLATVPHWFGLPASNENYRQVADQSPTLVAMEDERAVGFVTVVRHSPHAAELAVMA